MVKDNLLPTDLILDILTRLPVKTLSRFKCVSKPWLDLISNPFFICCHRDRSHKRKPLQLLSMPFYPHDTDRKIDKDREISLRLSSYMDTGVDGQLHDEFVLNADYGCTNLLSCDRASLLCCVGWNSIYVCNPSTREFLTLPKGSYCEHGWCNGMVGFAYLPLENEYKVVRLFYKHWDWRTSIAYNDFELCCEILTLRDGGIVSCCGSSTSWKVLPEDQHCPYPVCYNYPPTVNEAIHWLVHIEYRGQHFTEQQLDDDEEIELIVSFNVRTEKFNTVPAPKGLLPFASYSMVLTELKGFLVLVLQCTEAEVDIWVLKDYNNLCWMKEYKIDLSSMDGFDYYSECAIPRDINVDGSEILVESDMERLDYYNIETKSFRNVRNLCGGLNSHLNFQFYWESFFLLGLN